ncbi:MAG: flavodoxin domain-containing protein [Planctomycetes bacterium]|nr:flavodoxin domain-containing protein [Planctomycetota bacterium]
MITQVKDKVFWVGVVDWDLRSFHGHELSTHRGSTYNAYLIQDEKTVLVDTVWEPHTDRLMENISELVDPSEIDIVVANHAEIDHSGGLPEVMRAVPDARLVCSKRAPDNIKGHFHEEWNFETVETGDSIDIGENKLVFVEAPMLHWPDSMFTYLTGSNVLMPNDAFGQHYASAYRFNDEVDQKELYEEAFKYYVNILNPFGNLVERKIQELVEMDVPVDVIAPSHGVIWRDEPFQIVEKYQQWAQQEPEERAVLLYDTMWGATRRMAEAIGDGFSEEGIDYKLIDLALTDRNDALVEVFRAGLVAVGSPTINKGVLPTVTPILEDLRGLGFKNKKGAAFGSYGWGGGSVKRIEESLEEARIPLACEGLACQWQPEEDDLDECRKFGRKLATETFG